MFFRDSGTDVRVKSRQQVSSWTLATPAANTMYIYTHTHTLIYWFLRPGLSARSDRSTLMGRSRINLRKPACLPARIDRCQGKVMCTQIAELDPSPISSAASENFDWSASEKSIFKLVIRGPFVFPLPLSILLPFIAKIHHFNRRWLCLSARLTPSVNDLDHRVPLLNFPLFTVSLISF